MRHYKPAIPHHTKSRNMKCMCMKCTWSVCAHEVYVHSNPHQSLFITLQHDLILFLLCPSLFVLPHAFTPRCVVPPIEGNLFLSFTIKNKNWGKLATTLPNNLLFEFMYSSTLVDICVCILHIWNNIVGELFNSPTINMLYNCMLWIYLAKETCTYKHTYTSWSCRHGL